MSRGHGWVQHEILWKLEAADGGWVALVELAHVGSGFDRSLEARSRYNSFAHALHRLAEEGEVQLGRGVLPPQPERSWYAPRHRHLFARRVPK